MRRSVCGRSAENACGRLHKKAEAPFRAIGFPGPETPFSDWRCQKPRRQTVRQHIQSEQSLVDGGLSDKWEFIEL